MVEQLVRKRENAKVDSLDGEKAAVLVILKVEMWESQLVVYWACWMVG